MTSSRARLERLEKLAAERGGSLRVLTTEEVDARMDTLRQRLVDGDLELAAAVDALRTKRPVR